MIVRLEPRGEAKSTAELYLSGKGTVFSQTQTFFLSLLFCLFSSGFSAFTCLSLLTLFFSSTEIELAKVPMGKFLYLLTNSELTTFQKSLMTGDRIFFFFLECSKNGLFPKKYV